MVLNSLVRWSYFSSHKASFYRVRVTVHIKSQSCKGVPKYPRGLSKHSWYLSHCLPKLVTLNENTFIHFIHLWARGVWVGMSLILQYQWCHHYGTELARNNHGSCGEGLIGPENYACDKWEREVIGHNYNYQQDMLNKWLLRSVVTGKCAIPVHWYIPLEHLWWVSRQTMFENKLSTISTIYQMKFIFSKRDRWHYLWKDL